MKRINTSYLALAVSYVVLLGVIVILANVGWDAWVFSVAAAIPYGDKIGHIVLAGVLSFVVNRTLRCRTVSFLRRSVLLGSAIVAGLVLLEECSQLWIAERNVDIWDLLADFVGIHLFGRLARYNMKRKESVS